MPAAIIKIDSEQLGQRIDNFLIKHLKGVPNSRIYRALRQGEVRVNKGRVKQTYRLQLDDLVRIPPIAVADAGDVILPSQSLMAELEKRILYETDGLLVIDKPAGMPVHGGSGISSGAGLIEALRLLRPQASLIELVHRLDKETSGCLLIAKKRAVLLEWHRLLAERRVKKQYLALVKGQWQGGPLTVTAPLLKNHLQSGERIVTVNSTLGKLATTYFRPIQQFKEATLVEARPVTGRTHQIRVHATHMGHPIAGDEKYGDRDFNQQMRQYGIKRLFLHAGSISCKPEENPYWVGVGVSLEDKLREALLRLL